LDRPRPVGREVEVTSPATRGDATGKVDEAAADRLSDDGTVDAEPERCDPADEVVGDTAHHRPGGIGVEATGRAVRQSGRLLQIPDGELDYGMATVVGVERD